VFQKEPLHRAVPCVPLVALCSLPLVVFGRKTHGIEFSAGKQEN
jgi:hypothetical protein